MEKPEARSYFTRGKGFLSAAGPQARFILFLIFLLVAYTLLLRVFQKLAAIVELPVFLPIALITLLAFIGVAGTLYSHRFIGPVVRIRRTLEQVAHGDCSVSLRLRDSDDPVMKELVETIGNLCEHSRHTHQAVHDAARDLSRELTALREGIEQNVTGADVRKRLDLVLQRQAALEKAVHALGK
jgi:nitrogen fixation/metabolism regulation signal transduction histidine kinase